MNDTAYVAVANSQIIAAFDISNPASPGEFWPLHCGKSWNHGITATGGYLYVASDYKGLMVINTADTENWKYLDAIARSFNLHVSGGYAYVGSYINQLGIVDISDPANPGQEVRGALSCQCDTEYDVAWDAYVDDGYAFVANDHSGLAVLDVSDPLSPQAPVMFNNGNIAINRVVARDGFAYTTWYDNFDNYDYHDNYNNQNKQKDYYNGDLVVVDARDPLVLTEAARVDLENAMSIALEDNFAYVGEGHEDELNGALSIVDVADPENPVIRSTISLAGASWAIKPVEHTLFIAARSAGLLIVDATDPDNPQQIGQ